MKWNQNSSRILRKVEQIGLEIQLEWVNLEMVEKVDSVTNLETE